MTTTQTPARFDTDLISQIDFTQLSVEKTARVTRIDGRVASAIRVRSGLSGPVFIEEHFVTRAAEGDAPTDTIVTIYVTIRGSVVRSFVFTVPYAVHVKSAVVLSLEPLLYRDTMYADFFEWLTDLMVVTA